MSDPLRCTFEDARRVHLLEGIALSTSAKVAFSEEMLTFALHFGARDRLVPPDIVDEEHSNSGAP